MTLVDGNTHRQEAGNRDDDDLGLTADAGDNDDERDVSKGRDVTDELDPWFDDVAHGFVPSHEDGDRERDGETESEACGDRD